MDIQRGVGREEKNPRRGTKAWREIEGGRGGRRDEGWEEWRSAMFGKTYLETGNEVSKM